MKRDDFKVRYIIKLASSIVLAILNVIIQLILPRALSVEEYGYYSYNLNVFTSIVGFANLSASSAMISKFAKHVDEIGFVSFYLKFYGLITLLLNISVMITFNIPIMQNFYGGQMLVVVLLGLEVVLINKLIIDGVSIGDAMEITRFTALCQILMKTLCALAVISGYLLCNFNLLYFYLTQFVITCTSVFLMIRGLLVDQKSKYPNRIDRGREYLKEYFLYCKPLFVSNSFTQISIIFMNWVLLHWGGVTEQAMFGAAWQINSLVSYVFSTYSELLKREFAVLYTDIVKLRIQYEASLRRMIWITSYFSLFIGFCSKWFLQIVFGDKYGGATIVTLLIMFYTIYQSWGQVSGSFFLALERTKISALQGIVSQVFSIICIFIFQIPNILFPSGLGSIGIALTYLIGNVFSVELGLFLNAKFLGISFIRCSLIQVPAILTCSMVSLMLKVIFDTLIVGETVVASFMKFTISGFIYSLVLYLILNLRPQMCGLSYDTLNTLKFWRKIRKHE